MAKQQQEQEQLREQQAVVRAVQQDQLEDQLGTVGPLRKSSLLRSSGASGEFLCCRIGRDIRELETRHHIVGLFRPNESQ